MKGGIGLTHNCSEVKYKNFCLVPQIQDLSQITRFTKEIICSKFLKGQVKLQFSAVHLGVDMLGMEVGLYKTHDALEYVRLHG